MMTAASAVNMVATGSDLQGGGMFSFIKAKGTPVNRTPNDVEQSWIVYISSHICSRVSNHNWQAPLLPVSWQRLSRSSRTRRS